MGKTYCLKSSVKSCKVISYEKNGSIQNQIKITFNPNAYVDGQGFLVSFVGNEYFPLKTEGNPNELDISKIETIDSATEFEILDKENNNQAILLTMLRSNSDLIIYFQGNGKKSFEIYGVERI